MLSDDMLPHTASVRVRSGEAAYGPTYVEPFPMPCYFSGQVQMVRNADGEQVISSSSLLANITTVAITPGSMVTVDGGVSSRVITVNVIDDGGITGLSHQKLMLE